jgi:hypothetical protein
MLHRTPHPVLLHSTVMTSVEAPFCHIMYIEDLNNTSFDVPIVKKFQTSLEVRSSHDFPHLQLEHILAI